ncbi:DUF4159 domain-containing protein [Pseudothioclava nitratireducens]|uniref:DUF4159 domain-containing protein n=1 Tax=Pseudothioclava nitratireducens TaxID=1928646 RepID=UPI0023DCB747|nr:DUF4159 domain-containing protein [Defluviimonas nitratireducens]MDF1619135.1 DUF4159 domain-containing protein [Defluviimonas nitratireducens]
MWMLGPVGFTAPWLLLGLAALPVLWLLLRAVPPAPLRRRFPGVALLLGLTDEDVQAERTPWWLMLLRMAALAAAIIGFAGPVLNPVVSVPGQGPLLIVADASWASARDWSRRIERMDRALGEAQAAGRPVALLSLTEPPPARLSFADAGSLRASLPGIVPQPWEPGPLEDILPEGAFETFWLSDGLARESRDLLLEQLEARGAVRVWQTGTPVVALGRSAIEDGQIALPIRTSLAPPAPLEVAAIGLDPAGIERELARETADFQAATETTLRFDLPPELRNRITRFEVAGIRSAGAVSLTDDAVKRRKVALVAGGRSREGLELLSPLHYLREALAPSADLIESPLEDALPAKPDVVILADIGEIAEPDRLAEWVEEGGLLVRFAGPRLAAADSDADPLLPVRLRAGGRSVGGTMSWGEPRGLAPFPETSPFAGLPVPEDVTVTAQVMAEPSPDLSARTIATLVDGTPLVTRADFGTGSIVLIHVTANAEWSSLPLSGLFPQMLERLAISARPATPSARDLAGVTWVPTKLLDAFGRLDDAGEAAGVPGETLAEAVPGPDLHPGLYAAADRVVALNAVRAEAVLAPAVWPAQIPVEGIEAPQQTPLKGWLLMAALGLLLLDIIASLALSGRLMAPRARRAAASALIAALALGFAPEARAEETAMPEARAIEAAGNVVLAHIATGDPEVDRVALEGLRGLSKTLFRRTTVEPSEPMTLDLETDDLALFTLIYWPVTSTQPAPSPMAYSKLNRYLRGGGMIVFDTRDADISGFGTSTDAGRRLQALAAPLDIPPLEPIPTDHVLTRTFYLLQSFPGRYDQTIWVEAAPPDAELAEGMPFRNLNDGVTPVVIGGNDWAAAWAMDERGLPMFPIGRGMAGERQREVAQRFGVNLVMHVLTGNYKSDQVHVPALLERLGQ